MLLDISRIIYEPLRFLARVVLVVEQISVPRLREPGVSLKSVAVTKHLPLVLGILSSLVDHLIAKTLLLATMFGRGRGAMFASAGAVLVVIYVLLSAWFVE